MLATAVTRVGQRWQSAVKIEPTDPRVGASRSPPRRPPQTSPHGGSASRRDRPAGAFGAKIVSRPRSQPQSGSCCRPARRCRIPTSCRAPTTSAHPGGESPARAHHRRPSRPRGETAGRGTAPIDLSRGLTPSVGGARAGRGEQTLRTSGHRHQRPRPGTSSPTRHPDLATRHRWSRSHPLRRCSSARRSTSRRCRSRRRNLPPRWCPKWSPKFRL